MNPGQSHQYFQWLKTILDLVPKDIETIVDAGTDKASAVRIANFCRNQGRTAELVCLCGINYLIKLKNNL